MRHCLFVLGMHRSGTSALAGLFQALGADMGKDFLPPAPDNPKGFFENRRLLGINLNLQYHLGQYYFTSAPLPYGWMGLPVVERFTGHIRGMLAEEFGNSELMSLKDPRLCLLYPVWEKEGESMGIRCDPVLILRPALEVAGSLAAREGFPVLYGLRLWLRYVLECEQNTRHRSRLVLTYEGLLRDWRSEIELIESAFGFLFPRGPRASESAAARFLDPGLNHQSNRTHSGSHRAEGAESTLLAMAEILYETLAASRGTVDPKGLAVIDKVWKDFEIFQLQHPLRGLLLGHSP